MSETRYRVPAKNLNNKNLKNPDMKLKSFCLLLVLVCAAASPVFAQCPIIPLPTAYREQAGSLDLGSLKRVVVHDESLAGVARFLERQLLTFKGLTLLDSRKDAGQGSVTLALKSGIPEEGYHMEVSPTGVRIEASDPHGAFNGVESLLQLARVSRSNTIAACKVEDRPAMGWRGVMLDESRHFFGKQAVEQVLDWMAFYKLDRFHWHLTDVPGWRLQILRYPKLALVGGVGNKTDSMAPARYYTQQEIDEIVQYARERFITIIPEIDMPGHAGASNRAYPEFSGGGSAANPLFTFDPGNPGTYAYLTHILKEVNVLFPSHMIHIGGDEVSFGSGHWTSFPEVQRLMAAQHLTDAVDVERYFVQRMADSVISMGSKILGWDEIAKSELPPESTIIFWWRHDQPASLKESLDKGYSVVLCPRIPFYFDFVQAERDHSGRRWKGGTFSSEEQIYDYAVEDYPGVVDQKNSRQILGIQANLWSELVASRDRLQYMLFPRMAALAEAAWTPKGQRNDYAAFEKRVGLQYPLYRKQHMKYYDLVHPELTPEIIDVPVKK